MSDSEDLLRISEELERFGLSRAAARVYVALQAFGEAPALHLAKASGVHRVDVYKRLEELLALGFVSVKLGRPMIYEAVDPKYVLSQILESRKREFDRLAETKDKLLPELSRIGETPRARLTNQSTTLYQLIVGRQKGYEEAKRLVKSARSEIVRVVSPRGLVRNFNYGVLNEYKLCSERGVIIRIISNFKQVPKRISRFCVTNFDARHSSESTMRLLIVDRRAVLLSAVFNDSEMTVDSMDDRYLLIKDEKITDIVALLFEHLWDSSEPAERTL